MDEPLKTRPTLTRMHDRGETSMISCSESALASGVFRIFERRTNVERQRRDGRGAVGAEAGWR